MKITIWTFGYEPFTMGGDVWQPIKTDVEAESLHEIGRGYKGYLVKAPDGSTIVAESITGALVGPTIARVKKDIETGDPDLMKEQVAKAKEQVKRARTIDADEFWRKLKKDKKKTKTKRKVASK